MYEGGGGGRKSSRPPVYIAIVCGSFPVIYDYWYVKPQMK